MNNNDTENKSLTSQRRSAEKWRKFDEELKSRLQELDSQTKALQRHYQERAKKPTSKDSCSIAC